MKKGIHPEYHLSMVHCACGNNFKTRATVDKINVEICSECHPYFTGKQNLVDTAGRIEKYMEKYNKLLGNITELVEKGLLNSKGLKKDAEDLLKFKMEIIANKLNLVSREEFEVQKKIIEKLQKDLSKINNYKKKSKLKKRSTKAKKF